MIKSCIYIQINTKVTKYEKYVEKFKKVIIMSKSSKKVIIMSKKKKMKKNNIL